MAAQRPVRLTPKLRGLVAANRLDRPPVGRLTSAQAEVLALAAHRRQEFDEPVSAPHAIAALAKGRPDVAMPVLKAVLHDRAAPISDRVAAAYGLGVIATREAEDVLLQSARDRGPRVQQAVFAALGWFGGPEVADELGKIHAADAHSRRQMQLARVLAVHRHGLDGPFLPNAPAGRSRLTGRSKTVDVSLRAKTPKATANDLGKVQGPLFGIRVADRSLGLECARREWTLFVNKELGRSFGSLDRLDDRPWIAAVVCRWYPVRTIATAQYVLLTRPADAAAQIDIVRTDGEIVYTGTAERRGAATSFSVADVKRAGAAPLRLAGRLSAKGVELEIALAGPRRVGTPDTEPVSV